MTPLEHAAKALREAADALDAIPVGYRRNSLFGGPIVGVRHLRDEADYLERQVVAARSALGLAGEEVPDAPRS